LSKLLNNLHELINKSGKDHRYIELGIVKAVYPDKYTVDVKLDSGHFLPHLPVMSLTLTKDWGLWLLPEVGTPVIVVCPNGNLNEGKVIGTYLKDGAGNEKVGDIVLKDKSGSVIKLSQNTIHIKAKVVKVEANKVTLGNGTLEGKVVTTKCIDPFTGSPHPDGSTTVIASK